MFGPPICVIETGRKIGRRVDAAGDGRAPEAVAFSSAWRSAGDGDHRPWTGDTKKCLNVITTAGPHELRRAEGPIHTSLAR